MAVVRCSNGHYYDDEKFSRCPHCGIFANLDISQMKGGSRRKENDEKTVALSQTGRMPEDICRTIALEEALKNPGDDQKTVGYFSDSRGNDFVTGWLVCVEGPERGRDFRLYHGFNQIGRNLGVTVCLAGDGGVSRENHCAVVYEARDNRFYLVPEGGNTVLLNGAVIRSPETIKTGDQIGVGGSELEFVAFCREGRVWEKE